MQAIRFHEYGGPETLRFDTGVPEPPLGERTVLIAATAAGVNPIDWKVRSGARRQDFPLTLPAIPGRDVSGIVRAVGPGVRNFRPGDRVVACAEATYAELVAVEEAVLTHVPDGLDLADAAAIPLAVLMGDQLVRVAARVTPGQRLLVTGALGSVGRAAVHAARKLGASVIAGVRRRQVTEAAALGVADVLAMDDEREVARLQTLDAVADTVGGTAAAVFVAKVRPGGCFAYASVLPEGLVTRYPAVRIARVFARPDASKVREFADDVRDGRFLLPIGRRLALREAAQAHVLGERGGVGKIILLV